MSPLIHHNTICARERLEPFLASVHHLRVRGPVCEIEQRLDRLPHGHVHDHQRIVVGADIRRVATIALQPPDEARAGLGQRINRIELCHEIGQQRRIERRLGPRDVQLSDVMAVHHGIGWPS
jgi:hypothetical protein